MADNLTKIELEEPDKLQVFYEEFLDYASKNRTKLAIIVAAVLFIGFMIMPLAVLIGVIS